MIGFPTSADLTRHTQLCHWEQNDEFAFPSVKRASLSQTFKDAIDRDDASAVRDLCAEMSVYPLNEAGFLFRAVKRKSFGAALVLLELLGSDEVRYIAKDKRTVLHEAVESMHLDFLKKVLCTDVDINAKDWKGRTPLSIALKHENFDAVRLLLNRSDGRLEATTATVVSSNVQAWRKGFIGASSGGHDDIVPGIFSKLVEHSTENSSYLSVTIAQALARAASNNHEITVKTILDMGREMDLEKHYSKRLKEASRNGIEAIKLLEQPEVDEEGKTKGNALATAAMKDDSAEVLRLLGKGADINYGTGLAHHALHAAAQCGKLSMVHLLLDKGANVNAQRSKLYGRETALHAASRSGHDQIVQVLLDRGAEINAYDEHGETALYNAADRGHHKVVRLLLDRGADVNAQDGKHGTPLQAASLLGHDQIFQELLEYGNALQAASNRGHAQVVQRLLDEGADVNAQSGEYGNALQAASVRGHDEVVKKLLDGGANVNAQGGCYGTALQAASFIGHEEVVKKLLDGGANVNAQGGRFGNALKAALRGGCTQTAEILRQRGAKEVYH